MSAGERTSQPTDRPALMVSCPQRLYGSGICGKDCVFVSSATSLPYSRPSCPCSDASLGGSASTTTSGRPPLSPGVGARWSDAPALYLPPSCPVLDFYFTLLSENTESVLVSSLQIATVTRFIITQVISTGQECGTLVFKRWRIHFWLF